MKIKALTRSLDAHAPARKGDAAPASHNLDASQHPFDRPREYTRALNAAKLERMHAKPFVGACEGHSDGVYSLAVDSKRLAFAATGAGDGEIRLWDLSNKASVKSYYGAHRGIISSLVISPISFPSGMSFASEGSSKNSRLSGRRLLSAGTDRVVRMWDADPQASRFGGAPNGQTAGDDEDEEEEELTGGGNIRGAKWTQEEDRALSSWTSPTALNSLSHHARDPRFVSASSSIQLWDVTRGNDSSGRESGALRTMEWGAESINCVRFNMAETEVLASAGSDRGIVLYDLRSASPLTKMIMSMRANDIAWSPVEPTTFAVASEDHNVYTFDMRNLKSATQIYKSHVAAVMSVSYSPTGQELQSGSYDRTLRLWSVGSGSRSRDTYHASRMQRIFCSSYTYDNRFVLSGSDDGNLRIWKTRASEKLGIKSGKELAAMEYRDKLREKWSKVGDVGKIDAQRRLPKAITSARKLKSTMLEAERVKEERRRKHTQSGQHKPKAARMAAILAHKE